MSSIMLYIYISFTFYIKNWTSQAQITIDFRNILLWINLFTSFTFYYSAWLTKTFSRIWAVISLIFLECIFFNYRTQASKFSWFYYTHCLVIWFLASPSITFEIYSFVLIAIYLHNSVTFGSLFMSFLWMARILSNLLLKTLSVHISWLTYVSDIFICYQLVSSNIYVMGVTGIPL